jgi:hypothetical protein
MPFNGSGVFSRLYSWTNDAAASIKIRADRMDNEMNGMAVGLSTCLTKDGQTTVTANLPMATFRHTGVGAGAARTDYTRLDQAQDGKLAWVDGGGTADAITAAYAIPITTLVDGQLCYVRATAANATTTPTFSPNSLTARTIVKEGGAPLEAGNISADGHELILRYDLTNTRWELLNPKPLAANTVPYTAPTTTVAAYLDLAEGTSNGTNRMRITTDAALSFDATFTVPGLGGTAVTTDASQTLSNKALVGTATNDNAAAGQVGEYIEAELASGSATSLTTATAKTITSLSLTAGDWDVSGGVVIVAAATTTTTAVFCATNTVNNTFPSLPDESAFQVQSSFTTASTNILQAGVKRYSLASTTTVYLIAGSNFATSPCTAYGIIRARRVR